MASKKKVKKSKGKYVMARKLVAGLMLTCFLVFILGQVSLGVSAKSMLNWSSILLIVIGIAFQIILKLWSAWEDVSDQPNKTKAN